MRKKALWFLGLLALGLLMVACAPHATQSTLKPAGPTAQEEKNLFVPVFWVAVAVFVIVEGGILFIVIKYRHRKGQDRMPKQTHGNTRLEIGWTIVPALMLAVVMVPTVSLIWDLAKPPPPGALHVTVQGYQWWWGFQYTDSDMKVDYGDKGPITVADVLVIPAGRTVYLTLESKGGLIGGTPAQRDYEVIHSFWIPRLFGKQDVVPDRENHITFSADQPGTYTGQCAEFCGLEHARMKFRVVALDAQDWEAWVANQKQPAVTPRTPRPQPARRCSSARSPAAADRARPVTRSAARSPRARGAQPDALRRLAARVLRGLQLGGLRHDGAVGLAARSQRREAGCEDAQLPADPGRDRRPHRVPGDLEVTETA